MSGAGHFQRQRERGKGQPGPDGKEQFKTSEVTDGQDTAGEVKAAGALPVKIFGDGLDMGHSKLLARGRKLSQRFHENPGKNRPRD